MFPESQGQDFKTGKANAMMNAYFVYKKMYYKGEKIDQESWITLCDDKEAVDDDMTIYTPLSDVMLIEKQHLKIDLPFTWRHGYFFKKDKYYISVFNGAGEKCYELNNFDTVTIKKSYKLYSNISMERLFEQPAEKVITYFKDRGMTYCPLMNQ